MSVYALDRIQYNKREEKHTRGIDDYELPQTWKNRTDGQ